jgi:hypothetical protein
VAEKVAEVIVNCGVDCAVIGAAALAVHGYARATEDLDLATDTDPFTKLRQICTELEQQGFSARLSQPDAEDPLGGVITVAGPDFSPVQVVNFHNPFRRERNPGGEAIRSARLRIGTSLKVVDLPHLVALKLYSGGAKGKLDVIELLERNPTQSIDGLRQICGRFGLDQTLQQILTEIGAEDRE